MNEKVYFFKRFSFSDIPDFDENFFGGVSGSYGQEGRVYMVDMENAIWSFLLQEVALKKEVKGEALTSLGNFLTVLVDFFPGRDEVIRNLYETNAIFEFQI